MYAGVEASGLFRSEDGGDTWHEVSSLRRHPTHELWGPGNGGKCLHTLALDPFEPVRLYVACSTGGVYRSDDGGDTWLDVGGGLPADFGFPIVAHPGRAETAFVVPPAGPEGRWPVGDRLTVFRTDDGGETWRPAGTGLPGPVYTAVLRDAFTTDGARPPGLYLGTAGGHVYASADEGATWREVAAHLPRVLSVQAVTLEP